MYQIPLEIYICKSLLQWVISSEMPQIPIFTHTPCIGSTTVSLPVAQLVRALHQNRRAAGLDSRQRADTVIFRNSSYIVRSNKCIKIPLEISLQQLVVSSGMPEIHDICMRCITTQYIDLYYSDVKRGKNTSPMQGTIFSDNSQCNLIGFVAKNVPA